MFTHAGVLAVMRREVRNWVRSPLMLLLLIVFPTASAALVLATFNGGAARNTPVAVVDQDQSARSRELVRMIDAAGGTRVLGVVSDVDAGRRRVMDGEAYGVVVIPAHFERDVVRGAAPAVSAFYNAQFLLPASLLRTALVSTTATLSAQVETRRRMASGEPTAAAVRHVEPVRLDLHTIANTELNYVTYLVVALLPTLLQIFIVTVVVQAFAGELRDATVESWMQAAGGSVWRAIAGKALPYAVHFTALGLGSLALVYGQMGVPFRGSLAAVAWATAAFACAYVAMGFACAAATGNLRIGTSAAAFYCAPAFAFVGVTFPVEAMPVLGQAWSSLLPVSHYLRILVQQGLRAAPLSASWHPFLVLAAFATLPWPLLTWRMARLISDPKALGRS